VRVCLCALAASVQPLSCLIVHRVRSPPFSEFQTHVTVSLAAFFALPPPPPPFFSFFFFLFFGGGVLFDLILEPCLYTDKGGFVFYGEGFSFSNFVM
jgi:hypothetical protein